MKLISPAVKERFAGFKKQFHKEYANETEEEKRLIIFDQNLKEMFKRSKYDSAGGRILRISDKPFDGYVNETCVIGSY